MSENQLQFFNQEQVDKANQLASGSNEEIKAYKQELHDYYLEKDSELKGEEPNALAEVKENYNKSLVEIEETRKNGVDKANADFLASGKTKADKAEYKSYQDILKGVETVAKRAKIKAKNNLNESIKNVKMRRFDLHAEYTAIYRLMGLSQSGVDNLRSKNLETRANFNLKATLTNKKTWVGLVPLFMLAIIIAAYYIGKTATGYSGNIGDVINNGIFVAVVATGAVYIYSQGGFDMSLGSSSLTCAIVAALLWNKTQNLYLSLIVAVVLGCALGIINAIFATMLNLPVMVMTLTMMNILAAINEAVLGAEGGLIYVKGGLPRNAWIYALFLVTFFLICWSLFNYTKLGRRNKFIGSNKKAAKFNGIDLMKAGMVSFGISGIGLGICGFLFASSNSLASGGGSFGASTVLGQVGLNVVIAIVFGGMTTSGGPKSKVSCAIIGAFFSVFLDEFFAAISTPTFQVGNYCYMVKGIIFIVVSLANMWDTRSKNLASGGSIQ